MIDDWIVNGAAFLFGMLIFSCIVQTVWLIYDIIKKNNKKRNRKNKKS